jgi:DNA-binding response OmpR family regulator
VLVISDVELRAESGFELARTVRERWPRVAIILTSGRANPAPGDLPEGAVFLPKPFPLSVLVGQVRALAKRAAAPAIVVGEGSVKHESNASQVATENVIPLRGGRS